MMDCELPVHLQIEPTQLCGLNCIGCSRMSVYGGRERKSLTVDDFRTLTANAPSVHDISLHGLGEPFMNDQLADIAVFLRSKGIVVRTVTNGNVVNPRIAALPLLESMSEICFSVDSHDADTYRQVRRGGELATFKRVVSSLSGLRAREHISTCTMSLNCVLSAVNMGKVSGIPRLARELGMDKVIFNVLSQFFYTEEDGRFGEVRELTVRDSGEVVSLMLELKEECERLGLDVVCAEVGRKRYHDCFWPVRGAFVTADGFVTPCNYRMNPDIFTFGNLFTQTMRDIWCSEKYVAFRKSFQEKRYHDFCLTCG